MNNENNISPVVLGFVGLVIAVSVGFNGYLFGKVGMLEKGVTAGVNNQAAQPQQQAAAGAAAAPQVSMETIKGLFGKDLIKFGKGDKKLLMVEISDPSCPYCHVAGGQNTEIGAKMGDQFKLVAQGGTYVPPVTEMKKLVDSGKADFVWIYSPGHGNGQMGTKAMYCAFEQGKFWQVHDLLMSAKGYDMLNTTVANDKTKSQQLVDFLASAADANKLKSCLDSGKYDKRLTDDTAEATALGVQGTPGFFLNTTNFGGAYSWSDMKSVADAALK